MQTLNDAFNDWLRNDVCYSPRGKWADQNLPTPEDVKQLNRGRTAANVLQFLIENLRSSDHIRELKDNIKLYELQQVDRDAEPIASTEPEIISTAHIHEEIDLLVREIRKLEEEEVAVLAEVSKARKEAEQTEWQSRTEREKVEVLTDGICVLKDCVERKELQDALQDVATKLDIIHQEREGIRSDEQGNDDTSADYVCDEQVVAEMGKNQLEALILKAKNRNLEKQLSVAKFSEDIAANLRLKASRAALQEAESILRELELEQKRSSGVDNAVAVETNIEELIKAHTELEAKVGKHIEELTEEAQAVSRNAEDVSLTLKYLVKLCEDAEKLSVASIDLLLEEDAARSRPVDERIVAHSTPDKGCLFRCEAFKARRKSSEVEQDRLDKEREAALLRFDVMQLREELDLAHSNAKGLDEMTLLKFTRLANVCRHATNATVKGSELQAEKTKRSLAERMDEPGFKLACSTQHNTS